MRLIVFAILSVTFFISCSDTTTSPKITVETFEYYPLQIGNTWKYVVLDNTGDTVDVYNLTVETTEIVQSFNYFKISNSSERLKRAVTYSYQRVDKGKIYTYDNFSDKLSIDFTGADTTTGYVIGTADSLRTAIGTFDSVHLVRWSATPLIGESYAPKVGRVFGYTQNTTSEIIYAKIGAKEYK